MKRIKMIYGVTALLLLLTNWSIQFFYRPYALANGINDYHFAEWHSELFKVPVFVCVVFALFNMKWSVPRRIFYCTLACLFYECLDLMFLNPINWMRIIALLAGAGIFYVLYLIFGLKSVAEYREND